MAQNGQVVYECNCENLEKLRTMYLELVSNNTVPELDNSDDVEELIESLQKLQCARKCS